MSFSLVCTMCGKKAKYQCTKKEYGGKSTTFYCEKHAKKEGKPRKVA